MSGVFISYSRKNIAFARQLHHALEENDFEPWIDWQDIPPTTEWLAEIFRAIEQADTFIFIISRESTESETCRLEINHAKLNNKRLIPVVIDNVEPQKVSDELANLNWLFMREGDEFRRVFQDLIVTIQTDYAWVKEHTRLQMRALEWMRKKRDQGSLLAGKDLKSAEMWLEQSKDKDPLPTDLHQEFITASSKAETYRRSKIKGTAITTIVILIIAAFILNTIQTGVAEQERLEQLNAKLFQAILSNDSSVVINALQEGAEANAKDLYGLTPLHKAAQYDYTVLVKVLIDAGANVNGQAEDGSTPLHVAAFNGHTAFISVLLDAGTELNTEDEKGLTPLHYAVWGEQIEVAKILLSAGAEVDMKDIIGQTSLHNAAYYGYTEITEVLLKAGAEVNVEDNEGLTPLHLASTNSSHAAVVSMLLNAGADMNAKESQGMTPIHYASWAGHTEVVTLLLNAGAEVNMRDSYGETPLYKAVYQNHEEVAALLNQNGGLMR